MFIIGQVQAYYGAMTLKISLFHLKHPVNGKSHLTAFHGNKNMQNKHHLNDSDLEMESGNDKTYFGL